MKLTENAKKDFENWYLETKENQDRTVRQIHKMKRFYSKINYEKYGVYLNFFYSRMLPATFDPVQIILKNKTLEESIIESINEANEIYNRNVLK